MNTSKATLARPVTYKGTQYKVGTHVIVVEQISKNLYSIELPNGAVVTVGSETVNIAA